MKSPVSGVIIDPRNLRQSLKALVLLPSVRYNRGKAACPRLPASRERGVIVGKLVRTRQTDVALTRGVRPHDVPSASRAVLESAPPRNGASHRSGAGQHARPAAGNGTASGHSAIPASVAFLSAPPGSVTTEPSATPPAGGAASAGGNAAGR